MDLHREVLHTRALEAARRLQAAVDAAVCAMPDDDLAAIARDANECLGARNAPPVGCAYPYEAYDMARRILAVAPRERTPSAHMARMDTLLRALGLEVGTRH
jgi:hypothetical protein